MTDQERQTQMLLPSKESVQDQDMEEELLETVAGGGGCLSCVAKSASTSGSRVSRSLGFRVPRSSSGSNSSISSNSSSKSTTPVTRSPDHSGSIRYTPVLPR